MASTQLLYLAVGIQFAYCFPGLERDDGSVSAGTIDFIVQLLAIITQLLLTGRIAQRLGVRFLLVALPLLIAFGFVYLAVAPSFFVLAVVMIARRAGEYALVRPGREMLFTCVPLEEKYKAKNFIDTVVYRGADALAGWLKTLIELLAYQPGLAAIIGALIALFWARTGLSLAKIQAQVQPNRPENITSTRKSY
jgi:ATP:ADP antiporter, AAA family